MPLLTCDVSESVLAALRQRSQATGENTSTFVSRVLRRSLAMPMHTLFQVSTSRALVQGVYQEAVSTALLLNHGDFGLGTFDQLDGEMVVLDGIVYQVRSDGTAALPTESAMPIATSSNRFRPRRSINQL
jgi:acetolactate decarboxylase